MATMAAPAESREALIGPAAQRLDLGLQAARSAAALRRAAAGDSDDVDRLVLGDAETMLRAGADVVEFVESGQHLDAPQESSYGFGSVAFTVEVAAPAVASDALGKHLRGLADELHGVVEHAHGAHEPGDVPIALINFFSVLADVATRQAGTVGEGGQALILQ